MQQLNKIIDKMWAWLGAITRLVLLVAAFIALGMCVFGSVYQLIQLFK